MAYDNDYPAGRIDADVQSRNTISKRQIAVLICLVLAAVVWVVPPPASWKRQGL